MLIEYKDIFINEFIPGVFIIMNNKTKNLYILKYY